LTTRLFQDARYALRVLRKSPGFTAVAVLTLALGIGVNTALFSVASYLLRSLPGVTHPEQLVQVWRQTTSKEGAIGIGLGFIPFQDYFEYRRATDVFTLAAAKVHPVRMMHEGASTPGQVEVVTGNYFETLGVKPRLGRVLQEDQLEVTSGAPVAVASYSTWQRRFGGAPDVVGKSVKLNGQPFTIIGVAPREFNGLARGFRIDFWVPTSAYDHLFPNDAGALTSRGRSWWIFTGRLKPGVSIEQAQDRAIAINKRLAEEFADDRGSEARVFANETGPPEQRRSFVFVLGGFLALGGLVLLVACANVCNLLLARAQARHREMAIRSALGASRGSLIRQLLTESALLAVLGGGLGLLLAVWTNSLITAWWWPEVDGRLDSQLTIDGHAMGYAGLLLFLATIVFGLVPALRLSSLNLVPALKGESSPRPSRRRLSGGLVIAQVGTAFVLLVISGLLVRSMRTAEQTDLGFDARNVLAAQLDLAAEGYPKSSWPRIYRDLRDRAASLPGVTSATIAGGLPMVDPNFGAAVPEGSPTAGIGHQQVWYFFADPDFLPTLHIPLLEGRNFEPTDDHDRRRVAIVTRSLAHLCWPGQSPLGHVLRMHAPETEGEPIEIVGVTADAKLGDFREHAPHGVFLSLAQSDPAVLSVVLRTTGDPRQWSNPLRRAIQEVSPEVQSSPQTYERLLQGAFFVFRVGAMFALALALLALLLAMVGLYGVIAFGVSQKTREVGIRMALGANASHVLWLFVRRGLILTAAGLALGLLGALASTRVIGAYLYGVSPVDPTTFALAPVVFGVVAVLASYLPARRATRVDPMVALRCE
jgi:predicted permease